MMKFCDYEDSSEETSIMKRIFPPTKYLRNTLIPQLVFLNIAQVWLTISYLSEQR